MYMESWKPHKKVFIAVLSDIDDMMTSIFITKNEKTIFDLNFCRSIHYIFGAALPEIGMHILAQFCTINGYGTYRIS